MALAIVGTAIAVACGGSSSSDPGKPGGASSTSSSGGGGPGGDGGTLPDGAPLGGPLATLKIDPASANVTIGLSKQFSATALDADGKIPFPAPQLTWSVSGGGAVGSDGLFVASTTPGGPYVLTVASGPISATAMVTVVAKTVYKIGETNVLATDDNPPADTAIAEQAELAQPASINSFSLYVKNAAGQVRFAVYDSTGPDNGPGAKLAETGAVDAAVGWMTVPVVNSVNLAPGTYWIAFDVSDGAIGLERDGNGTGNIASAPQTFGDGFPDTFSDMPDTNNDHHSFYATLTGL